jgi:hypothetical protein
MIMNLRKGGTMKRQLVIIFTLLVLFSKASHITLTLQKALDNALVKAQARSLGGYQDKCMEMSIKNLTQDSLIVVVEAGRRLNSLDDQDQDILIIKQETIFLGMRQDKWFTVTGYCCQAHNHSPKKMGKYDVNTLADSSLVILARYLDGKKFDHHAIQQAIWAISDKESTGKIASKTDTTLTPLRELVATLKGEPLPWFSIASTTYEFSNGRMENFAVWLRGKIEYSSDEDNYVTLHILNSKGEEMGQIVKMWSGVGKKTYDLSMSVAGFPKGKYTVEIVNGNKKELAKKEFEI